MRLRTVPTGNCVSGVSGLTLAGDLAHAHRGVQKPFLSRGDQGRHEKVVAMQNPHKTFRKQRRGLYVQARGFFFSFLKQAEDVSLLVRTQEQSCGQTPRDGHANTPHRMAMPRERHAATRHQAKVNSKHSYGPSGSGG